MGAYILVAVGALAGLWLSAVADLGARECKDLIQNPPPMCYPVVTKWGLAVGGVTGALVGLGIALAIRSWRHRQGSRRNRH